MANNKMLIDASHPEETRVAVVRGNRIEEFDFESQAKKQLRGNIYLAKVTRVEPSLQAAFVDYGGNRHGFLAFSEIHPDYYQIPTADRQALLEEEARHSKESAEEEDAEPKRRRSRRTRKPKGENEETLSEMSDEDEDGNDDATQPPQKEAAEDTDDDDGHKNEENDGKTIAAIVETDSISEPAPEDDNDAEEPEDETGASASEAAAKGDDSGKEEKTEKPKRRTRRTSRKPKKTEADEPQEEAEPAEVKAAGSESSDERTEPGEEANSDAQADSDKEADAEEESPKRSGRKRRSRRGGKSAKEKTEAKDKEARPDTENGDDDEDGDVESVGQEDALEEVPHRRNLRRQYNIQEVIKRRQIMLVQVVKEERGNKGAALTTYLSLAGRYSVLMPNTARGGGISRKITNAADRKRLKAIAAELDVQPGMGVILRTAGASRTKAEIKRDFEYLMRLWETVRSLTLSSTAPCLVYEEGSLIKRSIRDLYDKDTGEIIVAGDEGYKEAKEFMRMLMPSHAKNVKPFQEDQAIFSRNNVEQQLDQLLTPQVTLKSGGYLVINQTEALVSIDVNSGRSTREHSIENTAVQTNLEAADEIARQLRLRDLAGLIVIDFIDMEEKRNNRAVEKRLKEALKNDRARIQVGRISHFGLMEMSRQRIRASVMESTMDVCPHCGGAGHVRSESSIALHVYRAIEDHLNRHPRHDVVVRCPTAIALDLLNAKRGELGELESRFGVKIIVQGDASLPGQSFAVERGERAAGNTGRTQPALPETTDTEAVEENSESNDGDQEENGNRKRRGRRRRGQRVDDQRSSDSQSNSQDADDQSQSEDDSDSSDDADGSRRKRRRGKRGGRRNRRQENGENQENGAGRGDDGESTSDDAQTIAASDHEDPEVAEKSSVITAPEDSSGTKSEKPEAQNNEAAESTRSRGRNTRRPRKTQVEAQAENPDGENKATEQVVAGENTAEEEAEQEETGKSKRGGWWRRGNFF